MPRGTIRRKGNWDSDDNTVATAFTTLITLLPRQTSTSHTRLLNPRPEMPPSEESLFTLLSLLDARSGESLSS
ncbi:hypothetical protein Tco_1032863 [Tanacetum coccineum]|uniref:Uncharacterized protein n=1 Tax=Tanacetum coccineum TaxID=301880 RepID=A0ABQ5GD14_9ASTR